jgi:translocation and assembly module TamB
MVVLDRGVLDIDRLDLALGPARVRGSLELGNGRVQADARLDRLPLGLLQDFGGPVLDGSLTARAALSGSTRSPTGTAELRVVDLALDPAAGLKPDAVLEASLARGRLEASLRVEGLGQRPIVANAALPATFRLEPFAFAVDRTAPLTGSVNGPLDLARVDRFAVLDTMQLAGEVRLALVVRGTGDRPELGGTIDLAQGSVQEVASGIILRDLRLRAVGQGRRLVIQDLSARDPVQGRLTGSGALTLQEGGGLGYEATLTAREARVMDNRLGVVVLTGNLGVTGDLASAAAKGALTVERADIAIPEGGGPSVPVIEVTEINGIRPVASEAAPRPPFALGFDIGVKIPARLFVRGRGLDSEWSGDLQVKGDLAAPQVLGVLKVRRGFLDLLDRRFTIRRGEIAFVGSQPPLPMMDLEATARTAEIEAVIGLRGPAADPKITLSSEPVLPQDEVLSRLLFGRSVARITPVQGLRLAAAVNQLQGGGGLSDVLSALRRGLGVDTLDVQGGETAQDSSVRAGKYVRDNVFVEVERGVAAGSGKARVQIELTPNLSVGTEVNEQSQTGVGLQWRYDY